MSPVELKPYASVTFLPLLARYGHARQKQLDLRRQMAVMHCEWRDMETAACHRLYSHIADKCDTCRKRDPIYLDWVVARREEKSLLRRIQRRLERVYQMQREETHGV